MSGVAAGSVALQADSLDFLGDAATYGVSLFVLGRSLRWRAGAALGIGVQFLLPRLLHDLLPFEVEFVFAWTPVVRGLASGLVICVLFTLLPLLAVRRVPPLAALRSAYADGISAARDPWPVSCKTHVMQGMCGETAASQPPAGFVIFSYRGTHG